MNRSVTDVGGGLLLVPQFTLAADTRSGTRPRSRRPPRRTTAAACSTISCARRAARHAQVETGRFGADMKVSLTNDGPVTFWLQVSPKTRDCLINS